MGLRVELRVKILRCHLVKIIPLYEMMRCLQQNGGSTMATRRDRVCLIIKHGS